MNHSFPIYVAADYLMLSQPSLYLRFKLLSSFAFFSLRLRLIIYHFTFFLPFFWKQLCAIKNNKMRQRFFGINFMWFCIWVNQETTTIVQKINNARIMMQFKLGNWLPMSQSSVWISIFLKTKFELSLKKLWIKYWRLIFWFFFSRSKWANSKVH